MKELGEVHNILSKFVPVKKEDLAGTPFSADRIGNLDTYEDVIGLLDVWKVVKENRCTADVNWPVTQRRHCKE